jgi:hypothetical protein
MCKVRQKILAGGENEGKPSVLFVYVALFFLGTREVEVPRQGLYWCRGFCGSQRHGNFYHL